MNEPTTTARSALRQHWGVDRRWLAPLLALFVVKGVLTAATFAPFTGHDEVDHFFYIERLADGHGLGKFGEVLLPPAAEPYQKLVADFPYNAEIIQPPLYHLVLAPLYALIPGGMLAKLFALRLVSVFVGLLTLVVGYAIAAEIFPDDVGVRAGATAFIAMQPQFSFEAAIVNHDILVIFLATLLVWLLLAWGRFGIDRRRAVWLGLVVGAGMLTKVSFGLMIPVLAFGLALFGLRLGWGWQAIAKRIALAGGVGLAVASPWFARSLWLYGDPTGAQELRSIPGYGEQAQSVRAMVGSPVFWRGRLEDFWGNYGWRLIPLDPTLYDAIYLAWFAAAVGLLLVLLRDATCLITGGRRQLSRRQIDGMAIVAVWIVAMIAGVLYVGTIQFTQSRFAFPAMAGFGLATAAGYGLPLPARWRWVTAPVLFGAMLALNVVTTIRFIGPFFAGAGGQPGMMP